MARPRPAITGGGNASGTAAVLRFMNRRISVLRGTTVNEWGDKTNVGVPLYTGIPAAIAEVSEQAFDAASQRMQIIRAVKAALPGWADVLLTDTLYDPAANLYFMIEQIQDEPGLGYYPPRKLLTLRERSGVSVQSD